VKTATCKELPVTDARAEARRLGDLDRTDVAILRLLEEDGRTATAQIARTLGISEPTVRKRMDRLFEDDIIKVVAVFNPRKTGYATDVLIMIRVAPGQLQSVGQALAAMEHVVYLGYTTGRHDIMVEALFVDDEALFRFLEEELPLLGGIVGTETAHVLRTEKINYDWKLPAAFGSSAQPEAHLAPSEAK
jgi:Lrp/AsnC family transcriptional regulator, regulator for asnA, asnC and gidA